MNPLLDRACSAFGAASCETATLLQIMSLLFSFALAVVAALWLAGKLGAVLTD